MWTKRGGAGVALAMSTLFGVAGCGLLAAPITFPQAVASNEDMHLRGKIIDGATGAPVNGVRVRVEKNHRVWDLAVADKTRAEHKDETVDANFKIDTRGEKEKGFLFTFQKDGYEPFRVMVRRGHVFVPRTNDGRHPVTTPEAIGTDMETVNGESLIVDPSLTKDSPITVRLKPAT